MTEDVVKNLRGATARLAQAALTVKRMAESTRKLPSEDGFVLMSVERQRLIVETFEMVAETFDEMAIAAEKDSEG
jgi:hypothetical protein